MSTVNPHNTSPAETEPDAPGPPSQLDVLARRFRAPLVRFFAKRLGNHADAEDLAHDVLLRLVRREGAADLDHVEAYLFRSASNLLRDRARRGRSRHAEEHVSLEEVGYEGEVPSEEHVHENREALKEFLTVLTEMPPRRRTVFVMHRFMGLSYGAIAVRLGIGIGSVEKHMMKALLQLHCRLGPL